MAVMDSQSSLGLQVFKICIQASPASFKSVVRDVNAGGWIPGG